MLKKFKLLKMLYQDLRASKFNITIFKARRKARMEKNIAMLKAVKEFTETYSTADPLGAMYGLFSLHVKLLSIAQTPLPSWSVVPSKGYEVGIMRKSGINFSSEAEKKVLADLLKIKAGDKQEGINE